METARIPGNRCNHDPRRPRLDLQVTIDKTRGKPFPWLIAQALERLAWLYNDRRLFPELGARKRSERIEVMVQVGRAILRNTDRLTLRAGRPNGDGTFTGITMETIAGWARITIQRGYRALWDLRDAGFVELTQPIAQLADGRRRGLAAIRRPTKLLFERLQLGGRLRRERRQLAEQARKDRKAETPETIADRRRERRRIRASRRAAVLTARTIEQLASAAKQAPPPPRVYTQAELAEMLATRRRP
jgi:hypothetical protein